MRSRTERKSGRNKHKYGWVNSLGHGGVVKKVRPLGEAREPEESVHKKMHVFTMGRDHKTRFDKTNGSEKYLRQEGEGLGVGIGDDRRICGVSYVQKQVHIIQRMYQTESWNKYGRTGSQRRAEE